MTECESLIEFKNKITIKLSTSQREILDIRDIKKSIKIDYDEMGVPKRLLASAKYKSLAR